MEHVTHETFAGSLNRIFSLAVGEETVELELTEIDVAEVEGLPDGMRQPFTLLFAGSKDRILPEGLYPVEIEGGALDLYLIPILSTGERQFYQSVFN